VIDREAGRLARLEVQLLDISRLQGDGLALDRQVTDIASLTREVVKAMQLAGSQPLHLHAPSTLVVYVDPLRLNQVVVNLIDNARKFAPAGSCVEIELAAPDPRTVCLSVRDYGPGVPPAERERLFSRYHRAGTRRPAGGMGLGLYLSREIVEAHGGHIEAGFPPEGGTRFVVTLPRDATEARAEST
jgi:signal transduction histidine kinase